MAEPKQNTTFRYNEEADSVFKLFALGYDDFRMRETYNFVREYDWPSLHFVRNGKGVLIINNKEYRLSAGDFFLIPCNVPVMYYRDKSDPWRYYWFAVLKDSLFDFEKLLGVSEDMPVRKSRSPKAITTVFDSLFEIPSRTPKYFHALSCIMQIIDAESPSTPHSMQLYSPESIVEKTKNIIELNFMRPDFSVSNICNILYISQQHLCRLFKKDTGLTPVAYLAERRISDAAKLLEYHDYPIRVLAEKCGFSNEAYFMRCFKKRFGTSVKEFRDILIKAKDKGELL